MILCPCARFRWRFCVLARVSVSGLMCLRMFLIWICIFARMVLYACTHLCSQFRVLHGLEVVLHLYAHLCAAVHFRMCEFVRFCVLARFSKWCCILVCFCAVAACVLVRFSVIACEVLHPCIHATHSGFEFGFVLHDCGCRHGMWSGRVLTSSQN